MDDTCAICAQPFQWVAYGPCGHRDVCSPCVARLRFICDHRCCSICKTPSTFIFITRALGEYTRMISDFSILPSNPCEGQVGPYWFFEQLQAYFDDSDHYRMIKDMCSLSCSVCDKKNQGNCRSNGHDKFIKNIVQLKSHLFHEHSLFMCPLCLQGMKVCVSEQKLYTRGQLNRHVDTGDSEADGSEFERGRFMGHPSCEFCKKAFYGSSELYSHMSVEHYTCHLCSRQYPGQHQYHKDYDDLEMHFDENHFLCKDEDCLTNKFVVFSSEYELKRHVKEDHGGCMSQSKTDSKPDHCRGARPGYGGLRSSNRFPWISEGSSEEESDHEDIGESNPNVTSSELSAAIHSGVFLSSLTDLGEETVTASTSLEQAFFPPLPVVPVSSRPIPKNNILESQDWPAIVPGPVLSSTSPSSSDSVPSQNYGVWSSTSHNSGRGKSAMAIRPIVSSYASLVPATPGSSNPLSAPTISPCNTICSLPKTQVSSSNFPAVSVTQKHELPTSSQSWTNKQDLQSANKSLVEMVRIALERDEDKYQAFKYISEEFHQGVTTTVEYLAYVQQFGLSHLVPELARLCPDTLKQKDLVETYNASFRSMHLKESNCSRKGKQKCEESNISIWSSTKLGNNESQLAGCISSQNADAAEGITRKKKTPKPQRVRWGDGSMAALLDLKKHSGEDQNLAGKTPGLKPVCSAWRNGGGQRLVAMTRDYNKR